MRRQTYPYGKYIINDVEIDETGKKIKEFLEENDFPVIKYDPKNEGIGTLIIGVNKKISDLIKQRKTSGLISDIIHDIYSIFDVEHININDLDEKNQRIGIEVYLWPTKKGILMELFILPYMEFMNKKELYGITENYTEEITDWYLSEQIWYHIEPKIIKLLDAKAFRKE